MTLCSVDQAMIDSNLKIENKKEMYRSVNYQFNKGVMIGSSLGSLHCMTESLNKAIKEGYPNINRMLMLKILINLLSANVSIKYKLKGPVGAPTLACATGLNAVGDSFRLIKNNEVPIT